VLIPRLEFNVNVALQVMPLSIVFAMMIGALEAGQPHGATERVLMPSDLQHSTTTASSLPALRSTRWLAR
jgi:hypothetical protein